MILAMNDIMRVKSLEARLQDCRLDIFRNRSLNEFPDAIAHELTHFFEASLGQTTAAKGIVYTQKKVFERVRQRSIQVEYNGLVLHHCIFHAAKVQLLIEKS